MVLDEHWFFRCYKGCRLELPLGVPKRFGPICNCLCWIRPSVGRGRCSTASYLHKTWRSYEHFSKCVFLSKHTLNYRYIHNLSSRNGLGAPSKICDGEAGCISGTFSNWMFRFCSYLMATDPLRLFHQLRFAPPSRWRRGGPKYELFRI